jgi:hypothetical protein
VSAPLAATGTARKAAPDRLVVARPGRPGLVTVLRLAAGGGRADRVRIALTAVGAAAAVVALLAAATVAATGADDGPYTSALLNEPGLHPGVVAALVLLCVPVLTFTGQCARIGAPARDRRLATLRLIGATPADVRRIAGAETALAAALGALAGLGAYLLGRALLGTPVIATRSVQREVPLENGDLQFIIESVTGPALRLPTDVLPSWQVIVLVVVAVPLGAGIAGQLALRRVALTPFGLVRAARVRPVRLIPLVAFLAGTAGMAVFSGIIRLLEPPASAAPAIALLFLLLFLLSVTGLIMGTAALASMIGGIVAPRTGRPALLIAARRLRAAPHDASRANAAVLTVVMVAAAVQGYRENLLLATANNTSDVYASGTYLASLALLVGGIVAALGLLVGAVESVLTRRRTLAALVAAGTPPAVLRRAVLLEILLPLTPAILVSTAAGALAARGLFGTTVRASGEVVMAEGPVVPVTMIEVPVPWVELGTVAGLALTLTALLTLAVMPLLTRAVDATELRTT